MEVRCILNAVKEHANKMFFRTLLDPIALLREALFIERTKNLIFSEIFLRITELFMEKMWLRSE